VKQRLREDLFAIGEQYASLFVAVALLHRALQQRSDPFGARLPDADGDAQDGGQGENLPTNRRLNIAKFWSNTGDCWDNAVAESFFGSLKTELTYNKKYKTIAEARRDIFDYVEVFYNRQRLHSTLGYMSPEEFERNHKISVAA